MANVIQDAVVDGLPDVAHWPLWIGWSYNFMSARRVFIGGQDADLPPRYLLLVNVNGLEEEKWRTSKLRKKNKQKKQITKNSTHFNVSVLQTEKWNINELLRCGRSLS